MSQSFTPPEAEEILLEYFGADGAEGTPLCPRCGDTLEIGSSVAAYFGLQVEVTCPGCGADFSWSQPVPERPWQELHLHYFVEKTHRQEPPRCPFDDCRVSCAEFEGGVWEFICPYCNRRGRAKVE